MWPWSSRSPTPPRRRAYNESRRSLRRQIEAIAPTNRRTDIREALRAAAGLANPGLTRLADNQAVNESLPATLYILSDGGFAAVPDFSLGNLDAGVICPSDNPPADNLAIVAFATDRNPQHPERMQAFVSVANFGEHDRPPSSWNCFSTISRWTWSN